MFKCLVLEYEAVGLVGSAYLAKGSAEAIWRKGAKAVPFLSWSPFSKSILRFTLQDKRLVCIFIQDKVEIDSALKQTGLYGYVPCCGAIWHLQCEFHVYVPSHVSITICHLNGWSSSVGNKSTTGRLFCCILASKQTSCRHQSLFLVRPKLH